MKLCIIRVIAIFLVLALVTSVTARGSFAVTQDSSSTTPELAMASPLRNANPNSTPSLNFGIEDTNRRGDNPKSRALPFSEVPSENQHPKIQNPKLSPTSQSNKAIAASLFATKQSPGSIAVGAAEGNLTVTGKATSLYSGHVDPGNHVTNRGFCSWNRAKKLTVAQADGRCLASLQRKSAAIEQRLTALNLNPKLHREALVNGADLWNQSNSAGPKFARAYKQALDKGLQGKGAYIWARAEAFRNRAGVLDASGLFGICTREPFYQRRLSGINPYSEAWRWQCIALDQRRRVRMVGKVLKLNIGETKGEEENSLPNPGKNQQPSMPLKRNYKPEPDFSWDLENLSPNLSPARREALSSPPSLAGKGAGGLGLALISPHEVKSQEPEPDFGVLNFEPAQFASNLPGNDTENLEKIAALPSHPPTSEVLSFDLILERTDTVKATESLNFSNPKSKIQNPKSLNLKKIPKKGEKIAGYRVTSPFGKRRHPITKRSHFHFGVDLKTPINTNLYAIGKPGTQTILKCWIDIKGGGLVATMRSQSLPNLRFDALHLSWCRAKTNGARIKVDAGEIIGGTGNTGRSTAPHLHFQMRNEKTGKRISPTREYIGWVLTGKEPRPGWRK